MKRSTNQSGFGIIEIMISLALVAVLVVSIGNVLGSVFKLYHASQMKVQALALAQQSLETISGANPATAAEVQALAPVAKLPVGSTQYSREIVVANLCRNSSSDVVDCAAAGAAVDINTRSVTVTVYWTDKGVERKVSLSKIFTAWKS